MRESYYIGVYWSARAATIDESAARTARMLGDMGSCHELVSQWNQTANSFARALELRIPPTREAIAPLFESILPNAPSGSGHSFHAWNGRRQRVHRCTLHVTAGWGPDWTPGIFNCVVFSPPALPDAVADFYDPAVLACVIQAIVRAWDPDHAILVSGKYRDRYIKPEGVVVPRGKPGVGWMTYLRAKRLAGLPAERPCETIDIPDRGTLFIVTREHRFSVENPDDVAAALALAAFLEEHGALVPIPPSEPF